MNAAWHATHRMPKRATLRQRVVWHRAHAKHCGCRPVPAPLVALVNASERHVREKQETSELRVLLSGGDRRSLAQANRALDIVDGDPARIAELAELTNDRDPLVVQRSLDLLEKIAHENPRLIAPHKHVFMGPLADSDRWEIRLQIVRALPLFQWTPRQMQRLKQILLANVDYPQTFVRAWALDSLATIAEQDATLRPVVQKKLMAFERSDSKALQARARKIREGLAER